MNMPHAVTDTEKELRAEVEKLQATVDRLLPYLTEVEALREALREVEACVNGNASPEQLRRIVRGALAHFNPEAP